MSKRSDSGNSGRQPRPTPLVSPKVKSVRPASYQTRNHHASIAGQEAIAKVLRETTETEVVARASQFAYRNEGKPATEELASGCSVSTLRRFASGNRVRRFTEYCQALGLDPQEISEEATANYLLPELRSRGVSRVLSPKHTLCLGRDAELGELTTALRSGCPRLYLRGARGIGKTTLLDEVVQTLAQDVGIDRCIQIVIKPFDVLGSRRIPRWRAQGSIDHIERELTYACSPVTVGNTTQLSRETLFTRLAERPTLLTIDDLDCADELDAILGLIYGLPSTVQVVATGLMALPIERVIGLQPLSEEAIAALVDRWSQERQLTLTAGDRDWLLATTRGFPAAAIKAIALLAESDNLDREAVRQVRDGCVESYIQLGFDRLENSEQTLAAVLSVFPQPIALTALADITEMDVEEATAIAQRLHALHLATHNTAQQTCGAHDPERRYLAQKLAAHPHRDRLYQRWLDRYGQMAACLTPDDWKVWQDYSAIDAEWQNWLVALEWCVDRQDYDRVCALWAGLRGYTNLRGYWPERLRWLEWAIAAAAERHDPLAQAQFWRDKAWTLTLTDDPAQRQQADRCFQRAMRLAEEARDPGQQRGAAATVDRQWQEFQSELALEQTVLCLENGDLDGAQAWIDHERQQLDRLLDPAGDRTQRWQRQRLRADYYEAEIFYHRHAYDSARELYGHVFQQARELGWHQLCAYATNWLADIALCECSYETAEIWLKYTKTYLSDQCDSRSLGFYYESLARAYAGRNQLDAASQSVRRAANAFSQMGLRDRARSLLDDFGLIADEPNELDRADPIDPDQPHTRRLDRPSAP